jgi:acetoin:2,6-dichlorophenolindophenol oxidoreductase subunit alpha
MPRDDRRNLDIPRLRAHHRLMARIRALEQEALHGLADKLVLGAIHPSIGQEAIAAGVVGSLRRDDILLSTHRGHGHTLAKGADSTAMLKELLGRIGGNCGGKGGSMHIADFAVGMLGANGVVGANIVIAAGAAHGIRLRREDRVVCCIFGDGAINRGPFLEGLNWAAVFRLPVLFVCENNGYGEFTPWEQVTAGGDITARAATLGLKADKVDGNDLEAVIGVAGAAAQRARRGDGPSFIEALTYRHLGHSKSDPGAYRPEGELASWLERDPIALLRARLSTQQGVEESHLDGIEQEVRERIDQAIEAALAAPYPDPRGEPATEYAP